MTNELELKARAYDILAQIERRQAEIQQLQQTLQGVNKQIRELPVETPVEDKASKKAKK